MTTDDFVPGDVLEFKGVHKRDGVDVVEYRTAIVTSSGSGWVVYTGHHVDARLPSGSGAFQPERVATNRYGFHCGVRKIGKARLWNERRWYPQPGNRGYDLMC